LEAASHDDDKLFKEVLAPNFYAFATANDSTVCSFRLTPLVGCQVRVAQRHLHRAVTQEIPHGVQRDPALNEA
jgi:hypothetical protein